jgi:hypothetical protein
MKKFRRGHTLWIGEVSLVPGSMTRRTGAVAKVYPFEVLKQHTYFFTPQEIAWRKQNQFPNADQLSKVVITGRYKGMASSITTDDLGKHVHLTYRQAHRIAAEQARVEDDGFARGWEDFQSGL